MYLRSYNEKGIGFTHLIFFFSIATQARKHAKEKIKRRCEHQAKIWNTTLDPSAADGTDGGHGARATPMTPHKGRPNQRHQRPSGDANCPSTWNTGNSARTRTEQTFGEQTSPRGVYRGAANRPEPYFRHRRGNADVKISTFRGRKLNLVGFFLILILPLATQKQRKY